MVAPDSEEGHDDASGSCDLLDGTGCVGEEGRKIHR